MIEKTGVYRLSEIVDACHGDEVGSDVYIEYEDRAPYDVPFIRTSDIVNYEADLYPDYYVSRDDQSQVKQNIQAGDIIFSKDGKIGAAGMVVDTDTVIFSSGIEILQFVFENFPGVSNSDATSLTILIVFTASLIEISPILLLP